MDHIAIRIQNLSPFPMPEYASLGAAGADLRANIEKPMTIEPGQVYAIPTGIAIELPAGYEAQVRARSGLALKHGISLVNGIGTIDSDYRGEIKVILTNLIKDPFILNPGDRIAQMVIAAYVKAEFEETKNEDGLSATGRGAGGFGHTGLS